LQSMGLRFIWIGVLVEVGINHSLDIVWEGDSELRSVGGDCFGEVFGGSAEWSALFTGSNIVGDLRTLTLMTSLGA
jgi:hypothetical protein